MTVPRDHEMASDSAPNGQPTAMEGAAEGAARPELEPMETNDLLIVAVGTALFAIAALVLLPMHASLSHDGHGRWLWIAVSGFLLGLVGLVYCRRRAQRMSQALPKADGR